ncbi:MAG TPA: hypothetical protein VHK01_16635 [Lacipirellulaceae bacterium]|jgi:hypothetical protein|nr:hypothetical protein [Lacipirellulaceae bacterium]
MNESGIAASAPGARSLDRLVAGDAIGEGSAWLALDVQAVHLRL